MANENNTPVAENYLLKPGFLRRRLEKKSHRKLRYYCFLLALMIAAAVIAEAVKLKGLFSKILVTGITVVVVFKGVFFLKSKAMEKVFLWLERRPLNFYRLIALAQIAVGAAVLAFQ